VNRLLPKGEFARNVLTVMSGTTIAQAIPVAISPILTRLYTPADLGVMAMYVSLIAIAVVVVTGRYELAILLPSREREAFDLLLIAVTLAASVCALGYLGVALARSRLFEHVTAIASLGAWLFVLPISVLLMGLYQSLGYWNNRCRRYNQLAASRVGQSLAMCGVQVAAGVGSAGASGLILGYVVGQVAANALLVRSSWSGSRDRLRESSLGRAVAVARRHRNFPTFMVPGHLANVASSQMPVLMLSVLFSPSVAGFYALAERVLVLPSSIIGSAVGDVYRQQAAAVYNATGNCRTLYVRTVKKLALIALVPFTIAVLAGPWVFAWMFGPFWRESGEITALLATMVFFQIVSTPLSQTVLLAHMHRLDMIWQFTRLALSAGSIYLGHLLSGGYRLSIILYVASFSTLYLVHSLMQYHAARGLPAATPVPAAESGGPAANSPRR
jgi:O-antigen/teichoic acid export membrane protein